MRKLGLLALVALVSLIAVGPAAAKTKADAFAAKHHLKGTWKGKDADKDGLKNVKELQLGTNPRKADSDRDGLKDGDEVTSGNLPRKADTDGDGVKDGLEHAGVVVAFDGETVTLREFATRKKVKVTLDTACTPTPGDDEDPAADDASVDYGDDIPEDIPGEFFQDVPDEEDVDVDADASTCAGDDELEKGAVLQSAELENGVLVDYVLA